MKCLICYQKIEDSSLDYHRGCSQKMFNSKQPPVINFKLADLNKLAQKAIQQKLGLTGVQPKISLDIESKKQDPQHRLMIVGLWGHYILKPPTERFANIAIVEDLTMHLAHIAGINIAQHGLIKLKSGELAYITRRFDRGPKKQKYPVEDFCQLSELLTESKYQTSTEKAGKIISQYSSQPGLDLIYFYELTLFCYLTGNSDMHLKNFSLIADSNNEYRLAPAYDLLSTYLMPIDDKEEMALTINGKKAKLNRRDFISLSQNLQIQEKVILKIFERLEKKIPDMIDMIKMSFLSDDLKKQYIKLIHKRAQILFHK